MAATDARPVPLKNTAYRMPVAIRKNDGTLITTWTGADTEVSLDGAAFADATSEATEIGTSGAGYVDLTAAEMNADMVWVKITVTNTDALPLVVALAPQEVADLAQTADAIWDEALAGHAAAGSAGAALTTASGYTIPTTSQIADGVWDEPLAGHVAAGSAGAALTSAGSGADPATIADAVWDEALAGHVAAGSTGAALNAAGASGDPWTTALPGAYTAGQAGAILATRAEPGDEMTVDLNTREDIALTLLTLDDGVETGITLRQALRVMSAVLAGKVSGAEINTPIYRNLIDTANRVRAITTTAGNRTAVTLTPDA